MKALNGASPPDPKTDVARRVWEAQAEPGDPAWDDIEPDEQAMLSDMAEAHIVAHAQWLSDHGFRILSADAVARPQSEPEALAMVQAAKDFFDAQNRKRKLAGGTKKLILPPGTH